MKIRMNSRLLTSAIDEGEGVATGVSGDHSGGGCKGADLKAGGCNILRSMTGREASHEN